MGRCRDGSCPSAALGSPGQEGSCPPHLKLGSRGAMAFHPSPLLEGIAAQLVHPPFLKGRDAPSCLLPWHKLQFPGRQLLGELRKKRWSWQNCAARHQVVGALWSPPPQPVSHPSGYRGAPLPRERLLSVLFGIAV